MGEASLDDDPMGIAVLVPVLDHGPVDFVWHRRRVDLDEVDRPSDPIGQNLFGGIVIVKMPDQVLVEAVDTEIEFHMRFSSIRVKRWFQDGTSVVSILSMARAPVGFLGQPMGSEA